MVEYSESELLRSAGFLRVGHTAVCPICGCLLEFTHNESGKLVLECVNERCGSPKRWRKLTRTEFLYIYRRGLEEVV